MSWNVADIALRGAASALFVALAVIMLRDARRQFVGRAGVALSVAAVCYLVLSAPDAAKLSAPWLLPLLVGSVSMPIAFWIFAGAWFDDEFELGRRHLLAWLVLLASGLSHVLWLRHLGAGIAPDHPVWGQISTTVHHDLHHAGGFDHNFGFYFTWWDRLMGTEHPDYRQVYREVTAVPDRPAAPRARLAMLGVLALVTVVAAGSPGLAAEPALAGDWATQGYSARVRIGPCEGSTDRICGRIIWLWEAADASGRPVADANNPNPTLRRRPLNGATILDGFSRGSSLRWSGGRIYNPEDGRSYAATLTLRDANLLAVEGCALIFCRTQIWRRVSGDGAPL